MFTFWRNKVFRWQKSTRLSVSPCTVFYGTLLRVCAFVCVCVVASRPVLVPLKSMDVNIRAPRTVSWVRTQWEWNKGINKKEAAIFFLCRLKTPQMTRSLTSTVFLWLCCNCRPSMCAWRDRCGYVCARKTDCVLMCYILVELKVKLKRFSCFLVRSDVCICYIK